MAAYFFDSSAMVKRYVQETGTYWVLSHFKQKAKNLIYIARITHVEVISALTRRMAGNSLNPIQTAKAITRFRRHFSYNLFIIEITPSVVTLASALSEKHGLRAYDAVQLAVAMETNIVRLASGSTPLILISSDIPLNTAATAEGLNIDDPNNHP